ncbi:MAG: hypothetical protein M1150_01255 [Patescibacteria group bacterium]|nr:hypothetical protein [Patescibacteria group bacterium]
MKPWVKKFAIAVIYLIIITFLKGHTDWFFVTGGLTSIFLIDLLDRFSFIFVTEPSLDSSHLIRQNLKKLDFKPLIDGWPDYQQAKERTLHSVLFQTALVIFTFYAVSTAADTLIVGFLFGALIHLWLEQYLDFKKFGTIEHWFFLTGIIPSPTQATVYLIAAGIVFVLLSWQFGVR